MKLTTTLIPLTTLLTTALANPPSKSPPNPINHEEARKICNRLPTQARREICLRAIADPRRPPRLSERDGGPEWVDALPEYRAVDVDELDRDRGDEHEGLKHVKLPNSSSDQPGPWLQVPKDDNGEVPPQGQDGTQAGSSVAAENAKRDVQITEEGDGILDLAIPVPIPVPGRPIVEQPHGHARMTSDLPSAAPTTFQTLPAAGPPLTYAQALTLDASPTLAVHRTIQTATLSNGTEIRLEQTETATHDVHLEETEHQKGEAEEDKVVVHVKVFVEHLREKAERARRWVGL